ncbi:MAG: hypothetical protein L0177_10095, partial [Chloroflexi bacterium]|nr:hypothetical protein [Chloroflexota bacterium]
ESAASDLSGFGLNPAEVSLQFKTKDGKEYKIRFGSNNPTGSSTYAALEANKNGQPALLEMMTKEEESIPRYWR